MSSRGLFRRSRLIALSVGAATVALLADGMSTSSPVGMPNCPSETGVPLIARVTEDAKVSEPNEVSATAAAAMDRRLDRGLDRLGGRAAARTRHAGLFKVDVRVHVILRDDGTGGVTRAQIRDQLRVLSDGYAGRTADAASRTPFRFELEKVDYTRNSDWYAWSLEDTDDVEAKTALHRGGPDDLNVYVAGLEGGLLGYATFPGDGPLALDGVVVLNESLPGGDAAPYNEGDTLTHEVGHWLGLFHTFENGCSFPGDYVPDTPYQLDGENIFLCRESDDTCAQPGRDPVHNFMSYGDDPCLDRFSLGQSVRQILAWLVFRDPVTRR